MTGAALCVCLIFATNGAAQGRPQRVMFARGTHSKTITGRIDGYQYRDYVLGAQAGQTLTAKLHSANFSANFIVYSINGRATDNIETQDWSAPLTEPGDYVIRVLMVRSGARRKGATANYSLFVEIR
jgi:hypothetical protein